MKKHRFKYKTWHQPVAHPQMATFHCRRCKKALTPPLTLVTNTELLCPKEGCSLVPNGLYWPVGTGQDFEGQFAVSLTDVSCTGYHLDLRRLLGCCGPSGTSGRNRVCNCGGEVGTERSDCIWPHAVYLDPSQILAVVPEGTQ